MNNDHATYASYQRGCRCDDCCWANREYQRERKRRLGISRGEPKRVAQHGSRSKYVAGCRCDRCSQANRDYQRDYMKDHR